MDIESMERGKLSPLLKLMLKLKLTLGTAIMASGISATDMATMDTVLMDIESMERGKLSPGTAIMASGITAMDMATMDTVLMDIESMERGKLSPLLKLILKPKPTPGTAIMAT